MQRVHHCSILTDLRGLLPRGVSLLSWHQVASSSERYCCNFQLVHVHGEPTIAFHKEAFKEVL